MLPCTLTCLHVFVFLDIPFRVIMAGLATVVGYNASAEQHGYLGPLLATMLFKAHA